jgi:hypothetical protein
MALWEVLAAFSSFADFVFPARGNAQCKDVLDEDGDGIFSLGCDSIAWMSKILDNHWWARKRDRSALAARAA